MEFDVQAMAESRKRPHRQDRPPSIKVREAILLSRLVRLIPGSPHKSTLRRYCFDGVLSPVTQKLVKMEYVHLPLGIASTVEAYYQFLEKLNGQE
jgi:hypothetical protein